MDISVILDNGRPWAEVRELAQAADELGAYAIYLCDHFMGHTDDDTVTDEGMLESMTLLAALAPLTNRSRLGPLVLGGTYRHPAVVANQLTALDHVSGGRAIAGLGAGWQVNEHTAYGIDLMNPHDLSDRFEESVAVISALLRDDRSDFWVGSSRCTTRPTTRSRSSRGCRSWSAAVARSGPSRPRRSTPTSTTSGAHRRGTPPRAPSSTRPVRRSAATRRRSGARPASPIRSARTTREALEPYPAVCDEFVVFDWFDRPLQSTIDDLTAALSGR